MTLVLVYEPGGKAAVLTAHFASKQSRESVELLTTCHSCPRVSSFAFRSKKYKKLLHELDFYDGTDLLGMLPIFHRRADVLVPRLSYVIRRLLCLGSFSECWRCDNVSPISKGPSFTWRLQANFHHSSVV